MRIGVLAYNAACNFGANLQLLSTVEFLRHRGHIPYVINWCPFSLEQIYDGTTPAFQQEKHIEFRNKYYNETELCRDAKDVARVIEKYSIEGVIIGSDAVSQHHPLVSRIHFPAKTIISVLPVSEDRMFPNVFWGTFNDYLTQRIPVALMSASSQNSDYHLFNNETKKSMTDRLSGFIYVSVRDKWTQKMFSFVSRGLISPSITPDPVFAFNYNVDYIPTKEAILGKFSLPEKYFLFGLHNKRRVTDGWISEFESLAFSNGFACVNLPFPAQANPIYPFKQTIHLPLDPLDWYALIRYSSGYIGHNMHPIVVALHNNVPFFCIDHYGVTKFGVFLQQESSKIFDILKRAGFEDNRIPDGLSTLSVSPAEVYSKLTGFNHEQCASFSKKYYLDYVQMMTSILSAMA